MRLNEAEKGSALWKTLEEGWQAELIKLRMMNDADLNEVETAKLRGRIAAVKANLAMGADRREIEID